LNKPELIKGLQASFVFVKEAAHKVTISEVDVLQWHCDLKKRMKKKADNDADLHRCRVCKKGISCCDCGGIEHSSLWWDVCEIVALVQLSLAAAERVFSVLNNMWSDQQTSSLSDMIRLSLSCDATRD
jgi:hypothetical protein